MQKCTSNPKCALPKPRNYLLVGSVSASVRLLSDDLSIRDDESPDMHAFFQCLRQMSGVQKTKILDSDAAEAFQAEQGQADGNKGGRAASRREVVHTLQSEEAGMRVEDRAH
eukprot:3466781-Rhodomonas_salina.2